MLPEDLKQNITVYGPLFPEPVQVIIAVPMGSSVKLVGKGVRSNSVWLYRRFKEVIGQAEEVAFLVALTGRGKSPAVSESAVRNAFNRGIRWAEKSHQS